MRGFIKFKIMLSGEPYILTIIKAKSSSFNSWKLASVFIKIHFKLLIFFFLFDLLLVIF